jgi:hypothetical protein
VNLILELDINSNSVAAAIASAAQPGSGQRGAGGFASTLAAAQAGEAEAAGAGNLKGRIPAAWNVPGKKALNSSSGAASAGVGTNIAVAGTISAPASPVVAPALESGVTQASQTSEGSGSLAADVTGFSPSDAVPKPTPSFFLAAAPNSAQNSSPSASPSFSPNFSLNSAQNFAPGNQWSNAQAGMAAEPATALANRAGSSTPEATAGQAVLGDLALKPTEESQASLSSTKELGTGVAAPLVSQRTEVPAPELTLVAMANAEAGPGSFASASAAAPGAAVENDSSPQAGTESGVSSVMNGGISAAALNPAGLSSAILNSAALTSAIPSSGSPAEPGRAGIESAAARVTEAVASPSLRGTGASARTSILAAVLPGGSGTDGSGPESGTLGANQTPFSIFFSSPGPGTEAAASALPKMILPVAGAAMRDSRTGGANATGTQGSAASSGNSSGTSSGTSFSTSFSTSQNPAQPGSKDSSEGAGSGTLQATPSSRRDSELNAATAQLATSPTAAATVQAPPSSALATLPQAGPAAETASLPPKPDALPAAAASTSAGTVLGTAEALTAAAQAPVQMAQLVSRMGQSEMRIGMNTSAFGNVEVRTVVHASDVGLVIGSEKGDLRTLLANDMPAITNTLQQQNLRLNSVNFMQGFAFSNNASGGGDPQQRSLVPMRVPANSMSAEAAVEDSSERLAMAEFGSGGSLSILA